MDLGIDGKVALVAGGSSGLGLATAMELAREGAHVAIGARDLDRLAAAEREIKEVARGRVLASSVDITDRAAADRWVAEVAGAFGALHILVVSGGTPPVGGAARFAPDDYRSAADLVLFPAVTLALAAVPRLRAAGWGRILFVTSETAAVPIASLALSGVVRAGITRFAQSLAAELGRDGITVNVLAPAATRTPMVERAAARLAGAGGAGDVEAALAAMSRHTAVGRIARPDEFAAVAAFLAGERASYVTGQVHLVDGGASVMGPDTPHFRDVAEDTYR